jgi:hydroxymethylbilane synthase
VNGYLATLHHAATGDRVAAERACLAVLEGSCRTPIAAYAEIAADELNLRALIARPDGSVIHRHEARGPLADAAALGAETGHRLRELAGPGFLS